MNEHTGSCRDGSAVRTEVAGYLGCDLMKLSRTQIRAASILLARAFQNSPVFVRLFPNISRRRKVLPCIHDFVVRYGLLSGEIHTTSAKLEAVAIWFRSDKVELNASKCLQVAVSSLSILKVGMGLWGLLQYAKYAGEIRRHHAPSLHWHLYQLAVAPGFRGKGYASALIKPMLAKIDDKHMPCYLETHEAQNVAIYQHYGFKIVQEGTVPQLGLRHWAMLRG